MQMGVSALSAGCHTFLSVWPVQVTGLDKVVTAKKATEMQTCIQTRAQEYSPAGSLYFYSLYC